MKEWIDKIIELLKVGARFTEALGELSKALIFIFMASSISVLGVNAGKDDSAGSEVNVKNLIIPSSPEAHKKNVQSLGLSNEVKQIEEGWAYFTGKVNGKVAVFDQNTNLRSDYPKFPLYQLGEKRSLIHKNTRCDVLVKETAGFGRVWLQVRCPSSSE